MKVRGELRRLQLEIEGHGFTVLFPDYCEDAATPGLLGTIAGVTDWDGKVVKIGRRANPTRERMERTLRHELRHITEPEWDCGSRNIWDRRPGNSDTPTR